MIAAALPPMPPETDNGAIVFALDPILTPDWNVDVRIVLPVPFGVSVRLPLAPVPMVSAPLSEKLFAESVCVAAFIDSPLIVLVVLAAMIPAIVRLPVAVSLFAVLKKLILP